MFGEISAEKIMYELGHNQDGTRFISPTPSFGDASVVMMDKYSCRRRPPLPRAEGECAPSPMFCKLAGK